MILFSCCQIPYSYNPPRCYPTNHLKNMLNIVEQIQVQIPYSIKEIDQTTKN